MQNGKPIAKDVFWVGVNDRRTALFEGIWPIPLGVLYNSYLIVDEKTVLIDTVKDLSVNGYLNKLKHILGPDRQIDYLVINHLEPDHSGALPIIKRVFPNIRIVGNKKTAEFVKELYGTGDVHIVQDGDELPLGRRKLKFFLTPMVHWPETMMTYDAIEKMAEAVERGVADGGVKTIRSHNISTSHVSYILRDAWRYQGLILGSSTYDLGLFPPMESLLRLLGAKKLSNRSVGVFGSFGWSGGAVKAMKEFVEESKLELVEPVVEARFTATAEQLEQCHALGRAMAERIGGDKC